jgi:hypothetical protein
MGMLLAHIPFLPLLSKVSQSVSATGQIFSYTQKTGCAFAQPVYLLSRFSVIAEAPFYPEIPPATKFCNTSCRMHSTSLSLLHGFPFASLHLF